jgi:serine/threonine protein kinase/Tol biopolymer transport system component
MPITVGSRLGPYEIVAPLGAGGMGEVYRARDTKLNRDVAIKVLLSSVAHDADRLSRFGREAQLLAALNHPNIAHVHGLEESGGVQALVMELVEGPTLADRIAQGRMPLEEALPIARQIAEALEAAHAQGIIHRDLKPANIKVRTDGAVKVLDFGLAKALDPIGATSVDAAISPTLSMHATQAGVVLGTAAYMAPEQARGRAVDQRADIWAFGCVLFEMLTASRAFRGEDVTDTIVAVLSREPDWGALPKETPGPIRRLLRRSLEKDPKRRLDSAAAARLEIDDATITSGGDSDRPLVVVPSPGWRRALPSVAVAIVAAVASVLATWVVTRASTPSTPVTRFAITLPAEQSLAFSFTARDLVLSSDGTHLVYSAGAQSQLMVRALDQLAARPLAGIANARTPFLSPDGRWIGFFDPRGDLRKVSITGGPSIAICRVGGTSRGASWGPDDTIVFATSDPSSGLLRATADGGEPTVLTTADPAKGEQDHYFPSVLPGGRGVLFTIASEGAANLQVAVLDLKTGQSKTLIRNGSTAEYVETGHLIYVIANTLWAVPFDLPELEVRGDPVPVEQLRAATNFSVSRSGTLVFVPQASHTARALVWLNRRGNEEPVAAPPRVYQHPRLSPDGNRVAVTIADQGNYDVWTLDLARQTLTRLTFDPGTDTYPVWTPNGQLIVFASMRAGAQNLYRRAADPTGIDERLTTSANRQRPTAISPDGARVVFEENTPTTAWDLGLLLLDATPRTAALVQTRFDEQNPEISPDGRWLAYESNESGQAQVYVRPFPNVGDGLYQISTDGGRTPVWAPSGRELFFVSGISLLSVAVQPTGTFSAGNPTKLFDGRSILFDARTVERGSTNRMYDVSRDGQRFLMVKESAVSPDDDATPASLVVVLNWTEELRTKFQGSKVP